MTADRCLELDAAARKAYWERKDLPGALRLLREAIALGDAALNEPLSPADATTLKSAVKQACYNLGSFVWPGWGEPGIAVDDASRREGHAAALRNQALAIELDKPHIARGRAAWLVGAHELTAGDTAAAENAFGEARDLTTKAGEPAEALMCEGYRALALGSEAMWLHTIGRLADTEGGKDFVDQLEMVRRVLG